MPSPSLLLPLHLPPLPPRLAPSSRYLPHSLRALPLLVPVPRLALPPLRLPPAAARAGGGGAGEIRVVEGDGRRVIPIALLEVTGAARREQAVAAAAADDGGAAAEAHLGVGSEAMVMEAFLPGPGGAASTRVFPKLAESTCASCAARMSHLGLMVMEGKSKPGKMYSMGIAAYPLLVGILCRIIREKSESNSEAVL